MKKLIVSIVLLSAASAQGQTAAVWCVGESAKVKPADAPQATNLIWTGADKMVKLGSARNEYVAFQIGVRAASGELKDVTIDAGDLAGPAGAVIPKANIDMFVEHYLDVKVSSRSDAKNLFPQCTAGEHPTQMVPFNARMFGAPFTVSAGRNQPVWVDIYVPEDAKAGTYCGTFKVKGGQGVLAEIKVSLEVWNFTLPHETHFRTMLYTGPENLKWAHRLGSDMNAPEWARIEDQYFQMAHQHRLNFGPCAGSGLEEVLERYWKYYDGSGFKQRVGKGVGQTVAVITPEGDKEDAIKKQARDIVAKWDQKKPKALLIAYMWDEPHSAADFATSKQRCKWVHEAVGDRIKTFIATPQYARYDAGDVNIYSEPAIADIPKIIARGDAVWAVNMGYAAGPYVDSPGYGGRSIVWMNWKMDLGGWQFWDCCYWVDKQNLRKAGFSYAKVNANPEKWLTDLWNNPLNFDETRKPGYPERDAIRINGDGILFYPGHDIGIEGPIASFAMKSLRRGAQDYEYLWLLKQQGKEAKTKPIVDTVCPAAGKWNDDPEAWDKARLELARMFSQP
ncbi:MAG: glycoside hydrolase domain-containing protein [Phycisphaerae bacterium]